MIPISKNELGVLGFLIRNFSKRFTIRNIASKLKISAPGAHSSLKKLESKGIVKAERLGTGLFYEVNLDNKIGGYLAAIVLLDYYEFKIDVKDIVTESKAAIFDGKNLFVVTHDGDKVKDICYKTLKNVNVICKNEEEFRLLLKDKDKETLEILEKGNVLFGEQLVIDVIRELR